MQACGLKSAHKVLPHEFPAQTLEQAFQWPSVVCSALKEMTPNLGTGLEPMLNRRKVVTVSSHFSGICTQSRAADALESNGIGIKFHHARDSGSA